MASILAWQGLCGSDQSWSLMVAGLKSTPTALEKGQPNRHPFYVAHRNAEMKNIKLRLNVSLCETLC